MKPLVPRFRDRSLREMRFQIMAAAAVSIVLAVVLLWRFVPDPLPRVVRLGTGPVGGHYAHFGESLRAEVEAHGVEMELVPTAGSMENIRLLEAGEIDVGLVQSGNLRNSDRSSLESVAAVFYELVLVVERADWAGSHIEGGRIAVGAPGSGGHVLARQLLSDQGVGENVPSGTRLVEIGDEAAVDAMLAGELDSGVLIASLDDAWVPPLFADPGLRVTDMELAEAFTRHYRYLRQLVIPAGLLDLRTEIPPKDVKVIATTTSLVIGPDTHRALVPLLIRSAGDQLREGSLLAAPGHFPSALGVDAALAEEARRYFDRGQSFLYRWLPYRWAFTATRFAMLLLPLFTLLYPLYHSLTPAFRWAIKRRVYRWYRVLRKLERRIDTGSDAETFEQIRKELDRIGDEIRSTLVPASYGSSLFALRAHHQQIVGRLDEREERAGVGSG